MTELFYVDGYPFGGWAVVRKRVWLGLVVSRHVMRRFGWRSDAEAWAKAQNARGVAA